MCKEQLEGTPKQVQWATQIRNDLEQRFNARISNESDAGNPELCAVLDRMKHSMLAIGDAHRLIDSRHNWDQHLPESDPDR